MVLVTLGEEHQLGPQRLEDGRAVLALMRRLLRIEVQKSRFNLTDGIS
jgi:hypothetical protein